MNVVSKDIFTLSLFLCFLVSFQNYSQNFSKHFIQFTDKNNSPYSIQSPQDFLSPKAIARRNKYNIPVTNNDIPVNPAYVDSIKKMGTSVIARCKWLNGICINTTDTTLLKNISNLGFVKKNIPAGKITLNNKPDKFDSKFSFPTLKTAAWDSAYYGNSFTQIELMKGNCLHNKNLKGQNILIAVLDAGFTKLDTLSAFDSLFNDNRIKATYNFPEQKTDVFSTGSHGTSVLSVLAAHVPGKLIGSAPKADYILLRTEIEGSENIIEEYYMVSGMEFADSAGADIISISLGYNTFDGGFQNHSYADMDGNTCPATIAADIAASKGIAVITAAGNEGSNGWKYIITPGDADSSLTVGAIDANKNKAGFSSQGPTADNRIKPDIVAMGLGCTIAPPWGGISVSGGTSFSTPLVAGMVACLLQNNPNKHPMEIFEAIKQSSDRFNKPDTLYGYGLPDFCTAQSILSGINKINHPTTLLHIYPNPFSDYITIQFNQTETTNIQLFVLDISGKTVFEYQGNSKDIYLDTRKFSSGIYLIKATTETTTVLQKIVKTE